VSEKTAKQARRNNFQFPPGPNGQKVIRTVHVLHYDDGSINVLGVPKKLSLAQAIMEAALRVVNTMFVEAAMNDKLEITGIPPNIDYQVVTSNIIVPEKNIIMPS